MREVSLAATNLLSGVLHFSVKGVAGSILWSEVPEEGLGAWYTLFGLLILGPFC